MDKNLAQRLVSGSIYGLIIFLCTTPYGEGWLGNFVPGIRQQYLFFGLITFLLTVGLYECIRIMNFNKKNWEIYAAYPIAAIVFFRFAWRYFHQGLRFDFNPSELLGIAAIIIAVTTLFRFPKELDYDNGKLIFSIIYVAIPFSMALGLPSFSTPGSFSPEVFLLFVLIWSSDSFAYFTGRLFGKHKMAPTISPKKTWEGFAGGVFFTLILGLMIERHFPDLRGNWMVVGLLVSIFAPLGDLVESKLKRIFGVKDSGSIIPGHGGVLDRLDSFIICAPVVYLYFVLEKLF